MCCSRNVEESSLKVPAKLHVRCPSQRFGASRPSSTTTPRTMLALSTAVCLAYSNHVTLATFDGAVSTTRKWQDMNDPVSE